MFWINLLLYCMGNGGRVAEMQGTYMYIPLLPFMKPCIRAFYKIPQNSLPAVLLHMAGAFFIIPHTNTLYHIFLPCFLNITSAITHGRCILHNSTICCGILWNCIFIVVLYGCSSKFHNCGTLWNELVFRKNCTDSLL